MVKKQSKKMNYWKDIGEEKGFIAAVNQLGSDWKKLDADEDGCLKPECIWGRLAEFTEFSNKDTYAARKWLYTAWKENRRLIRTTFLSTQIAKIPSDDPNESPDNITTHNNQNIDVVSFFFFVFMTSD